MMKKLLTLLVAVAFALSVAQPAQAASYKTKILIEGGWEGLGASAYEAKTSCYNGGDRLDEGTRITVKSGSGGVLATGKFSWKVISVTDQAADDPSYLTDYSDIRYSADCQLYATLTLPTSKFYNFKFGTVDGGTYSFSEMKQDKWFLALTFG